MVNFLYHRVPTNLRGGILYPLNQLENIYPDLYREEMDKYTGREHVPQQRIPLFNNCLWNDVLFFTSAHPSAIYEERRKAGWPDLKPQKFFKIDPHTLNQSKLGIFLFQPWADPKNYIAENFTAYNYNDLETYSQIPDETKNYFEHEFKAGEPHIKLFWRYIPHIIYKGAIDISNTEIITVH